MGKKSKGNSTAQHTANGQKQKKKQTGNKINENEPSNTQTD